MTKGVVTGGTAPRRDGVHGIGRIGRVARQPPQAAVLPIVDEHRHHVGTDARSEGLDVRRVGDVVERHVEGTGTGLDVAIVAVGIGQPKLGVDA